jgi:N-acetylglutamate synthase-like GNAT family acetyltransferase
MTAEAVAMRALEGLCAAPRVGTVYQVEPWASFKVEARELFVRHWREVALNHAQVPLDVDYERYDEMAARGAVHVVTARRDGLLIGYHVAFIAGHMHYRSTLHAVTDVYWIAPECRHGVTAIRLFQAVERELAKRGVKKLFTATKLHLDQGPLFERLGYKPVERMYSKLLGAA